MRFTLVFGGVAILGLVTLVQAQVPDKGPPKKKLPPFIADLLKKSPDEFLKQFDKNKDALLQKDELPPFLQKAFAKVDRNADGALDRAEVTQLLQIARQFVPGPFGPKGGGPGGPPDFDALDKNADGRLTKDELKGTPWLARLADIDTNKDGRLDRRELEAYLRKTDKK
ncbi:MAG: hypothetical protein L0Y71_22920 [Gemmataceae bacterium]|nr:hypothetical protein [Gemmataceae bacterium]